MSDEMILKFTHDGTDYEVDHLGIGFPTQYGEFAVYSNGRQVSEFAIEEAMLKPEFQTYPLPLTPADVERLAIESLNAA